MIRVQAALLVGLMSLVCINMSGAESLEHRRQVRVLLEQCGVLERLKQFPRQVFERMGYDDESYSKQYTPVRDALFQAFDMDKMEQHLVHAMSNDLDSQAVGKALHWFQSPMGKKITDLERMTYSAHVWKERSLYAQNLDEHPPTQHRLLQVQQLSNALYLFRIDEQLEMTTALALTEAMNAALPREERIDPDHIRHELQIRRENEKEELQREHLASFLYLYHRLEDAEVEKYLEFLESADGKRFTAAVLTSLNVVFQSASEELGTAVGRALKGERRV
ncbi:MAG: hypothetical protein MRJ96_01350 [Nitrospirales bacterium]|nr:hypothetical protein [Nitrospira sp.]MDR4500089.1 hypothetical protein [Nitrospirales bacterium]